MNQHRIAVAPAYDNDFYAWSQHQAVLLRAVAKLSGLPAGLDLENIVEEIASLGKSDVATVRSFLRQMLIHILKAASEPGATAVSHWRTEVAGFQVELLDHYAPSMNRVIELDKVWMQAIRLTEMFLDERGASLPNALPSRCPVALNELLADSFDLDEIVSRVAGGANEAGSREPSRPS